MVQSLEHPKNNKIIIIINTWYIAGEGAGREGEGGAFLLPLGIARLSHASAGLLVGAEGVVTDAGGEGLALEALLSRRTRKAHISRAADTPSLRLPPQFSVAQTTTAKGNIGYITTISGPTVGNYCNLQISFMGSRSYPRTCGIATRNIAAGLGMVSPTKFPVTHFPGNGGDLFGAHHVSQKTQKWVDQDDRTSLPSTTKGNRYITPVAFAVGTPLLVNRSAWFGNESPLSSYQHHLSTVQQHCKHNFD